jgi:hypothetical protein
VFESSNQSHEKFICLKNKEIADLIIDKNSIIILRNVDSNFMHKNDYNL